MSDQEMPTEVAELQKGVKAEISRLALMFLAGSLIIFVIQWVEGIAVSIFAPRWVEDPTAILLLSIIPMYLIGMPLLVLLVKSIPGEAPPRRSMKCGHFLIAVVISFAAMYLSNIAGLGITGVIGRLQGQPVENPVVDLAVEANMVVTFFSMVICAPLVEEYIFRKLVIDRTRRFGEGTAIVISGLLFGLFHGNLSQFVYATALGMCFGFVYVKTGQLKLAVLMHMAVNFMGAVVSVLVLKLLRYEELLEISSGSDPGSVLAFVAENLLGWLVYLGYVGLLLTLVVAGTVMFIVFRKQITLEKGAVEIPKGKRFGTVFFNVGMVLYTLFWLMIMADNLMG